MFGAASVLTAGTVVAGLGVGLVAQVFAGTKAPAEDCAPAVAPTDDLVARTVLDVLPAAAMVAVGAGEPPAGPLSAACTRVGSSDGFEALWSGTTGAAAVRLLEGNGWRRTDPAGGPPGWFSREEAADDLAKVGGSAGQAIVFTKDRDGHRFGISVDRLGMSAWVE